MKKLCVRLALLPLVLLAACVGSEKSSTPLSPVIAGPIPGVGISAPIIVAPGVDEMIDNSNQPITLLVGNAETNGVRPLSYRFEIASDPNFSNPVFIKDGVPQDASGRTNMRLPGPLSPERKYFWHARAEDGANTGPYGSTSAFHVFTPVVLGAPTLISPINDATTSSQPRFVIGNAARSGPAGPIAYYLEIATSGGFAQIIAAWQFPESPNQTELTSPAGLAAGQYFWRVRAFDGGHTGPFSAIQSFRTQSNGGGGGGGGGGDGSILDTLIAVRAEFPDNWTHEDRGKFLNKVAWIRLQKGEPFGLLRKPGGNNCPTPQGVLISCDFLVYQPTLNGYDVLIGEMTPTWPGLENPSDNFSSDPSRFLAPVAP
jgi:hypothetical protein